MIETVYLNRDNPISVEFKEDGSLIDFSAATRMVLSFAGSLVVADTNSNPALIDWSIGSGVVEFNLNDLAIADGELLHATLVVYDPLHTDGQVLIHYSSKKLILEFKVAS